MPGAARRTLTIAALAATLLAALTGCAEDAAAPDGQTSEETSGSRNTPAVSDTTSEATRACPNPYGGSCLGDLVAGEYRTEQFTPRLTYAVPDGWSNLEDLAGNFLLLPPARDVDGVDAGTADYLGVYSGATVGAADCSPAAEPGVGLDPDAVVTALAQRPGLLVTPARSVVLGGLRGKVITIRGAPGTKAGCEIEGGRRIIPLIFGVGPASLEHAQSPGLVTHLYVLRHGESNVVIEASDVKADRGPFGFEPVVRNFQFAAP